MLLWGASTPLIGEPAFFNNLHIFNEHKSQTLDPQRILVYTDETNSLDIDDIRNMAPEDFLESSFITRFNKEGTYWLYYQVQNRSNERLSHLLRGGSNPFETYYILIDSVMTEQRTGYKFAAKSRSIPQGYTTKVLLDIPPQKTAHVYVKVQSADNMPIDLRASLEPYLEWTRKKESINLFEGMFSGLLLVIMLISCFLFGYTKQNVFIYFAFYALLNFIYFLQVYGIIEIWFHPETPDPLPILWVLPILSAAAYFMFAKEFLELRKTHPQWNNTLIWVSRTASLSFILVCVYFWITRDIHNSVEIMIYAMIVLAVFGIVFLIAINRKSTLIIRYFTLGTFLMLLGVLISAISRATGISNDVPVYVQAGLIVELIAFSLGISHKLKRDYENHEITQRSLILQLKNNERLQLNINQELTELVAARTQVIKKQNKALEIAREEAERATKAKSEFLSVMSHEIRTPLNAIISLSHIMEMDNEDAEMQEYIDALKFSAEGLHSLINDVLDYNKIEANKLVLESIEFSIIDLLRNIRDSFKYKARSQGIDLLVEIGEHMPDRVIGDPTRLTQIFNNLIGNAIKFTHEGHVHIKASLEGLKDDVATVNFEVNDTGIGIPKDKLKTIFEEYEQAGNETTRQYGGTGLGLSITQKLLRLMQSEIRIESAEEEGTQLSFSVSFKINQAFDMVNLQDQTRDKDLKQKKVLVVDDNDMNRLVLKRLLVNWNAQFEEASDGQIAVEKCKQNEYDLVLMDIEMKPLSGFAAAELIRKIEIKNSTTPLIAMSGYLTSEFEEEFSNSPFLTLVQKPFEPNELYRKILKHIVNKS